MRKTLSIILNEHLRERGKSLREISEACGLSHMTVYRAVKGYNIDIDSMMKLCNYLGVSVSEVLESDVGGEDTIGQRLTLLLSQYPEFKELFSNLLDNLAQGAIDIRDVRDIVNYATYRLRLRERNRQDEG